MKAAKSGCARVGFDWTRANEILDKLDEEIGELRAELTADSTPARLEDELGAERAHVSLRQMNEPGSVSIRDDGYVQDPSSQLVAAAVGAQPGERILDVCSAPGGKATAMAATGAFVVAGEVQAHRARLVAQNAARLRSSVAVVGADGENPPFVAGTFDRVLIDAPCSGLGALRRRPDARWRVSAADVDALAEAQQRMLYACAPLVKRRRCASPLLRRTLRMSPPTTFWWFHEARNGFPLWW